MKIVADITVLTQDNWSGVQYCAYEQIKALIERGKNHQFILFALCPRKKITGFKALDLFQKENVRCVIVSLPARIFLKTLKTWQKLGWPPLEYLVGKHDCFLSLAWFYLPSQATLRVVWIYDLTVFILPQLHQKDNRESEQKRLFAAAQRGNFFIAISNQTKKDAIKILGLKKHQVMVVFPGLRRLPVKKNQSDLILKKYRLKKGYFLSVGNVGDKRKNLKKLVWAFNQLQTQKELAIVGQGHRQSLDTSGLKVKFLGRVNDEELGILYQNAGIFVYVPLYEGFGLPVIEALFFGLPVVAANLPSIKEIEADSIIFVDPKKTNSIKKGLKKSLQISAGQRKKIAQKGKLRARLFNFKQGADKIIKYLETHQ